MSTTSAAAAAAAAAALGGDLLGRGDSAGSSGDATSRLIRSVLLVGSPHNHLAQADATRSSSTSSASNAAVAAAASSTDADPMSSLARRILASSIGADGAAAAAAGDGVGSGRGREAVRRRVERSYRRKRPTAAAAEDANKLQVQQKLTTYDHLLHRLRRSEDQHFRQHGGSGSAWAAGSGSDSSDMEKKRISDGVVDVLSRLVGTEGWEGAEAGGSRGRDQGRDVRYGAMGRDSNATARPSTNGMPCGPSGHQRPYPQSTQGQLRLQGEVLTLRDCLFALQGLDSERIRFYDCTPQGMKEATTLGGSVDAARDCVGVRISPSSSSSSSSSTSSSASPSTATAMELRCHRVLGSGAMDALRLCGEAGWLYRRVLAYIGEVRGVGGAGGGAAADSAATGGGAVARSLASALSFELAGYHRLISILEAQLTGQISIDGQSDSDGSEQVHLAPAISSATLDTLTVRQLIVHLRPSTAHLRTLATVVDSLPRPSTTSGSRCSGGKLIAALQKHCRHGDTRHSTLLHKLASMASEPWFDVLWRWTTRGTLPVGSTIASDSASLSASSRDNTSTAATVGGREFFVAEDPSVSDDQLWHGRFSLLPDNVPLGVITMDLAERITVLGKGINFIRLCLGDIRWQLDLKVLLPEGQETKGTDDGDCSQRKSLLGYRYDPTSAIGMRNDGNRLYSTISLMAEQVNCHILESLRSKHHLQTHLWALKQFLLLGRGDFVSALLDGLHRELDSRSEKSRRVGTGELDGVYVHNLMSVMEHALRTTNAKHLPPYVLGRLRVDLVTDSSSTDSRPDAWDAFHLAYHIDEPLTAVVHPDAALLYRRVFALLFRLKRIVYMLNRTWRQSTALHHALRQITLAYPNTDVGSRQRTLLLLRRVALTRQSILHFASNLQSYLMFEVVEGGYELMANRVAKATTLDDVIAAHDEYLLEVVRKSLLNDGDNGSAGVAASDGIEGSPSSVSAQPREEGPNLGTELAQVLDASIRFCRVHAAMFDRALKSVDIAAKKRRAAERRARDGEWGYDDVDKDVDGTNLFDSLSNESQVQEVESIANQFDRSLSKLLRALDQTLDGPSKKEESVIVGPKSGSGPWWRRSDNAGRVGRGDQGITLRTYSNDDSLRYLTFRLDFNEYYDSTGREDANNGNDGEFGDDE